MSTPYIVLAAILLVLAAAVGFVVIALASQGRCDRETRRVAEVDADNQRLTNEIEGILDSAIELVRGWSL